jgi:hypothetical protein
VEDYVFNDINKTQVSKICAVSMAERNEVWFFYPSASSDENDRYVVYNYVENHFAIGNLERTSGVDRGVFQYPLMADASGHIYDHERGSQYLDTDDSTVLQPYAESGPFELGAGDRVMLCNEYIPDDKTVGVGYGTLYASMYPGETETSQSFTTAIPTSLRLTGRWLRLRVYQTPGTDVTWRIGKPRLDVAVGGRR